MDDRSNEGHGRSKQDNRNKAVDEIPTEVSRPTFVEEFGRPNRKEALQRRKNGDEDREPDARPHGLQQKSRDMLMRSQKRLN